MSKLSPAIDGGESRYRLVLPAAVLSSWLLAILVYLPGLGSGLYLDDYYNLHLLAQVNEHGILAFVGSGVSGPFGRPLSYLTFALQAGSWPGNLFAFKLVNLLLHVGNGALIFFICRSLAPILGMSRPARDLFCVFAASLWLVHPMHLSTVLYIVQRMTELSALFMFAGVLGFLAGRRALAAGDLRNGYLVMTLAVGAGTGAAVLCKENGVLLPLLILALDLTLLHDQPPPPGYRRWRLLCLVLPALFIVSWLVWQAWISRHAFDWRPYSQYQKFLTEAPVLLTYLWNLLVPRPAAYGLFHDDFPVSRTLLEPIWTLPAVATILFLISAAFYLRRRQPMVAFGLLWFFGGHLLESTHLNLEIYFEHRNYLPSLGLVMLLTWGLLRQESRLPTLHPLVGVLCLYLALASWVSVQNSLLWRQPLAFAQEMFRVHPDSPWAMAQLGSNHLGAGDVDKAGALYRDMATRYPTAILPWLRLATISGCVRMEPVPAQTWEELERRAAAGDGAGFDVLAELDTQTLMLSQGGCAALDVARLERVVESMAGNARLVRERPALQHLAGTLHLLRGDFAGALEWARLARQASPNLARHWQYVELLLALGQPGAAEEVARFREALARKPVAWLAYRDKLAVAEARLAAAATRNREHNQ